jgi:hypothetical protein
MTAASKRKPQPPAEVVPVSARVLEIIEANRADRERIRTRSMHASLTPIEQAQILAIEAMEYRTGGKDNNWVAYRHPQTGERVGWTSAATVLMEDRADVFAEACKAHTQAEVAAAAGIRQPTLNQVMLRGDLDRQRARAARRNAREEAQQAEAASALAPVEGPPATE